MNGAEHEALQALVNWWRGKRPIGMSLVEHYEHPTVNVSLPGEVWLARCAARVALRDSTRETPRYRQIALEGITPKE